MCGSTAHSEHLSCTEVAAAAAAACFCVHSCGACNTCHIRLMQHRSSPAVCIHRAYPKVLEARVVQLQVPRCGAGGNTSAWTAWVPYKQAGHAVKRSILFSHGNAVDLGHMLPIYR